uniref:Hypotheticial protein n=1 Tax=Schistosoma japonicum TaxID=6182 RepID=C1LEZ5_SCHJA|nr:hypotheticial protein [Schistosoma japonicum]
MSLLSGTRTRMCTWKKINLLSHRILTMYIAPNILMNKAIVITIIIIII